MWQWPLRKGDDEDEVERLAKRAKTMQAEVQTVQARDDQTDDDDSESELDATEIDPRVLKAVAGIPRQYWRIHPRDVTPLTTWGEFIDLKAYYETPNDEVKELLRKVYLPSA